MFRGVRLTPKCPLLNFRRAESKNRKFIEYKFGSPERELLEDALQRTATEAHAVPLIIGNEKIFTGDEQFLRMPQNHQRVLAKYYYSNKAQINKAIKVANEMKQEWRMFPMAERIAIWNRCADILENEEHHNLNAAIMLGQAKTCKDAEDDTSNLVLALRRNSEYVHELSQLKPKWQAPDRVFPSLHNRPLDGFVAAIGPFNQTYVSANLALCPALCGNCVIWKPSRHCCLSSYIVYKAIMKAGLPRGVISFMTSNSKLFLETVTRSPDLAGINFTGRVNTFRYIFHETAAQIHKYRSLPRLVAECGGKNFHFVHKSADIELVADETVQGAFEYSGQRCSCCSRLYVPKSMWPDLSCRIEDKLSSLKIGDPCDFNTNTSAVISEHAFDRIVGYMTYADKKDNVDVVYGGDFCKTLGYFIEPTMVVCDDPHDRLLTDEIMGPVLSVYVYDDKDMCDTLQTVAHTSLFAYTGAIFASDDQAICAAVKALRMSASNLYINGRCTGRRDGHLPFGGSGWSGTNDKTGSMMFLSRWAQPQMIEENFPNKAKKDKRAKEAADSEVKKDC